VPIHSRFLVEENIQCHYHSSGRETVYNTRKDDTRIDKNNDFESNLYFCKQVYNKLPQKMKRAENSNLLKASDKSTCVVCAFPQLVIFLKTMVGSSSPKRFFATHM